MLDFVKMMASWGCDIGGYVAVGAITADQFKLITGKDYQVPASANNGTANVTPKVQAFLFYVNFQEVMRLEKDGINVTEMLISIKEDVASIKAKMSGISDTDKKADDALETAHEAKTQVNKLEHQFNQVVYIAATAVVLALFVYIIEKFL